MTGRGGYSIHKLDADEILDEATDLPAERMLPEPAAFRIRSLVRDPIDFAALGTDIFFAANPRYYFGEHPPPTLVYETKIAALAVGPPVPIGIHSLEAAMALGEKLYVLTSPCHPEAPETMSGSLAYPASAQAVAVTSTAASAQPPSTTSSAASVLRMTDEASGRVLRIRSQVSWI
ncbi:hypothetical protein D1007_19731 [Hordeum vulgare]|nr:hypothetical protein D1007_19731 [Hordeum vulgare]